MSASDVLIRIRLLLAERLSKPPTRGDNQKLSVAIWDLHNVVPNNTELFNIWQALSSSKKDLGRFEQGVRRLTTFLQSSAITGIAPALRTAAAFYNQSVKNDTTGNGDAVIRSGVPFVTPPPPPAVTPSASTRRPSAITVERITPAPSYDDHPFPDANRRQSGQTQVEIPQSDFTVAAAAPDPELDSFPDDAPPGYTFVAEAATPPPRVPVALPSPSPPPPPALPEKDTSYSSWQAPPPSDGASSSQARPSASHTRGSGSSPYAQTSERPPYSPSVTSSSHGVAQSPPKSSTPHTSRPTHTSTPSIPVYTPYEPSPTSANASFPQTYDSPSVRTTGGPVSSSSSTSAPLSQQASPPYQPINSSSFPHNSEPRALRSNATGTSTPYSSGEQPGVNQSWRPTHSSTHSIPAYSPVDPAPLSPPQPPPAMNDAVTPANIHPPSSTSRASALSGSAALYQQQATRLPNSSPVPPTTYPDVPASPPPVSSHAPNQRRSQPVSSPPPRAPQAFSTVAQYNAYPSPTSPANPNAVASPTTSSFSSITSSSSSVTPVRSDADSQGAPNAQYSWSAVGGAGQQPALSNQHTGGSGQQRPYQPAQYHSANLGMSQPAGGASRPPMVHSGTPPPQQQAPAPAPATSYPSPPPSASTASYGQTPLATSQPGAPGIYNQNSGRPPAHHANTTPVPPNAGLQHASWGNRVGQAPSNAPTVISGPLPNQYSGSFPPSPSVPSVQQQPQQPTGYSFPPQGAASNHVGQPVVAQSPQAAALSRPPIHHAATAPLPAHASAAYAHRGSVGQGNQTMQQPQANAQAAYRPPQFQTGNTATGQPQSSATRPYTTNQINTGAGQPNNQATRPSNAQGSRPHGYTVPAGNLLGTLGSLAGQFGKLAVAASQPQAPHHAAQAPGYNARPQAANARPPAAGRGNQNQNPLASAFGNVYRAYNRHQHQQQQQHQHQQQQPQQQQYQQQQQPQYNNDNGNYGGGGGGGGDGSDQVNYYSNPSDNTYSDPSGDTYYQSPDTSGDPNNTFDTTGLDNGDTWTGTGTDTYDAGGDGGGFMDSFSGVGDMMSGGTGDMFSGGVGDMLSGGVGDMFTGGVGDMLSGGAGDMFTGGGGDMTGWGQ